MKGNNVDCKKTVYYEQTPILYALPEVGSKIKICKREVNTYYGRDIRVQKEFTHKVGFEGRELTVESYTNGYENPLDMSNKCICSYALGDSIAFTSFPTVQISIGTVRCFDVSDKEQEREFKTLSRQA